MSGEAGSGATDAGMTEGGVPGGGAVAVLGLGLIGGSLARDLSARGVRVLGYDHDPGAAAAALRDGVTACALGPSLEGVEEAEIVVLAVPVGAAPELLARLSPRLGSARLVTDVGSTKAGIVASAARLGLADRFVGGHPLAGDVRSGWDASREGLFGGARVFLTPSDDTPGEPLAMAGRLWRAVGASPEVLSAEEHDRRLAWTSHLPQLLSTSLALALAGAGIAKGDLGPGGRDVARLAGSSPEMWSGICLESAAPLGAALASVRERIEGVEAALREGDEAALRRFFGDGRSWDAGHG